MPGRFHLTLIDVLYDISEKHVFFTPFWHHCIMHHTVVLTERVDRRWFVGSLSGVCIPSLTLFLIALFSPLIAHTASMSAFTFTAPIVTPEEERAEREALSDEDLQRLQHDLYGGPGVVDEHDEQELAGALALLQGAINRIHDNEKIAYMEALERAPDLVRTESDPVRMLCIENYDIDKAAHRLVNYWRVRLLLFGQDRCFLPMTLQGAIAADLETLQKGLFLELDPDKHGRPVFYMDRMRCTKEVAPRDAICRCLWYVLHTCVQRTEEAVAECVWLVNYRVSRF
jgi:hypothetical protein